MRIVVTGGSGFIGTRLVEMLLDADHEVVILDKRPSTRYGDLVEHGDVRRLEDVLTTLRGCDVVFHLAAEQRDDVEPPSLYYDVNVEGTANVVRAAKAHDIGRIIFTSSSAVYGLSEGTPNEESPPAPFNDYGKSKLRAEAVLRSWAERTGGSLLVVRPCAVFGVGSKGNVTRLIDAVARKRFLMVGAGRNRKSLSYVDNLAAFLKLSAEGEIVHEVVNYADKPDLTMDELVRILRVETGQEGFPPRIPYVLGMLAGYTADAVTALTGRSLPVSSTRLKKFCATTQLDTSRLRRWDFQASCSIMDGLRVTTRELYPRSRFVRS